MSDKTTTTRGAAGGSASTGGATFASLIAAWCATRLLLATRASLPWDVPTGTSIGSIACENASDVDDLVVHLNPVGTIYVQIKHGLKARAELHKALAQLVRQFRHPTFSHLTDRLVIATDYSASSTIRTDLRTVLERCRRLPANVALETCATNRPAKKVLASVTAFFEQEWKVLSADTPATQEDLRAFLHCAQIWVLDPMSGPDDKTCIELLASVVNETNASRTWELLGTHCLKAAWLRQPFDRPSLWDLLDYKGIIASTRKMPLADSIANTTESARAMTIDRVNHRIRLKGYSADWYVERQDLDHHLETFLESGSRIMVVSGESGRGKSSWCANHCKSPSQRPTLLVRGDDLLAADERLFKSFSRLLRAWVGDHHGAVVPEPELLEWFQHTPLLIFVDGLDRAPGDFSSALRRWLDGTLGDLLASNSKLVLTARPETVAGVSAVLDQSDCVYQIDPKKRTVPVADFDYGEAMFAAQLRGNPSLARYRHPSMMDFCARMQLRSHDDSLTWIEVMSRFFAHRIGEVVGEYGLLDPRTRDFVRAVGKMLAKSADGVLTRSNLACLRREDGAVLEALHRANFIVDNGEIARIEPDELSEYVQGRYVSVADTIGRLEQVRQRPLKLGALRSALLELVLSDVESARTHIESVIRFLEATADPNVFAMICEVLRQFVDLNCANDTACRLAVIWREDNIFLHTSPGDLLLELLADNRWAPMVRVALLWQLASKENGYDWRMKHWFTPEYAGAPGVTPWRPAMLAALADAKTDGLSFLLERFDMRDGLPHTTEAVLGEVAQGVFLMSAESQMLNALTLLARAKTKSQRTMLTMLAQRFPEAVLAVLYEVAQGHILEPRVVSGMLLATLTNRVPAQTPVVAHKIKALPHMASCHRLLLRALSGACDEPAAYELVQEPDLEAYDVRALSNFRGSALAQLLEVLAQRVISGTAAQSLLREVAGAAGDETGARTVQNWCVRVLTALPSAASELAHVVEQIIHFALLAESAVHGLSDLARDLVDTQDKVAGNCMVFGCTGHGTDDMLTAAGVKLRWEIVDILIEREVDNANLATLASNIATRHPTSLHAFSRVLRLLDKHSSVRFSQQADAMAKIIPQIGEFVNKVRVARSTV
ncbi:hypothetical protein [Caballeronia sp. LjRoot31]|uniref:hypothetical protein n=1 Tax=Caballeronia sp. LjRoot31 TaxID=3342324 RepID=UPI003ECDB096